MQYLNILLDDSSASYCHYQSITIPHLISVEDLKAGIRFAMMENLMIQFVYPDYTLPMDYQEVIESIDHFNIRHSADNADVCVVDNWDFSEADANVPIVLRTTKQDFFDKYKQLLSIIPQINRLNIVIIDIDTFLYNEFQVYQHILEDISKELVQVYLEGKFPQLSILTDRLMLSQMNNCGAGRTNITLAPNGKFYVCPAFYYENEADSIGDLTHGLCIMNNQLYKLDYAPICRHCDAYQCKRCIWLNRKTTLEVNTPSHEQCVIAHLERNASGKLFNRLRGFGLSFPVQDIKETDYLDPFDKRNEWQ